MKTVKLTAQERGRRGGLARAAKLSAKRRREIATMGGYSRYLSRVAANRIRANFRYLEAVKMPASRGKKLRP